MGIGERIRTAREAKNLTMDELAKQVGVNKSNVCRWEKDERTPRIEHLFRLSVLLDVDVNYLVHGRKAPESIMAQ